MPTSFQLQENKPDFLTPILPASDYQFFKATISHVNHDECLSAFVCRVENEPKLQQMWKKITNLIGSCYQVEQESEFSRWNIYLVFFVDVEITKNIKYAVENDPAFVRKLVFDNQQEQSSEDILKKLNQQIFGTDISTLINRAALDITPPVTSAIGQSLFKDNLGLSQSATDIESRTKWLDGKLQELKLQEKEQ